MAARGPVCATSTSVTWKIFPSVGEAAMQKALKEMGQLNVVKEISNFIRVEDL